MKYFTRMYVLDALAQLFKPLHNLGKLESTPPCLVIRAARSPLLQSCIKKHTRPFTTVFDCRSVIWKSRLPNTLVKFDTHDFRDQNTLSDQIDHVVSNLISKSFSDIVTTWFTFRQSFLGVRKALKSVCQFWSNFKRENTYLTRLVWFRFFSNSASPLAIATAASSIVSASTLRAYCFPFRLSVAR